MMIVPSDGYILDILGSFLADGKNNDAAILNKHLREGEGLLKWAEEKDIRSWVKGLLRYDRNCWVKIRKSFFLTQGK